MNHRLVLFSLLALISAQASAAPRIAVLLKDRDLFWSAAQVGADEAGKAAGVELVIKAPTRPNSLGQQLTMLNALAKEPFDALVIAPLTSDDFREPLKPFLARGAKIVALDTDLPQDIPHVYLGYNQVAMAEAAARYFITLLQPGEKAALLRAISIEGMSVREKTFISTFKALRSDGPLFQDVLAGAEQQDDVQKCTVLLERHPDIRAVCTPFSASSIAMIKVIKSKQLAGKVLHVGFGTSLPGDVVDAIENGVMQGWIAQQPKLIGQKGVEIAVEIAGGKSAAATQDVPYFIVTKQNLHDPQIQAMRQ